MFCFLYFVYLEEMDIWMPRIFEWFFTFCWSIINPLLLITILIIFNLDRLPDSTEGNQYHFQPG